MNYNDDPNKKKMHDQNCAGFKCKNCEFKPNSEFKCENDEKSNGKFCCKCCYKLY
jgi:hypothetical protein